MLTYVDADQTSPLDHDFTMAEVVEAFGLDLGLDDYPIFDEAYRATLNQRIRDHFWFRRIAAETPQMFVFFLNRRMREVMPTYNALYKAVSREAFDPFTTNEGNTHSEGTGQGEGHDTSSTTGTTDGTATTINSTTPASYITNPTGEQYMDGLTKSTNEGNTGGTSKSDSTNSNSSTADGTYTGRSGSWVGQMQDVVSSGMLEVDAAVCDALEPLFMQFWDDTPY